MKISMKKQINYRVLPSFLGVMLLLTGCSNNNAVIDSNVSQPAGVSLPGDASAPETEPETPDVFSAPETERDDSDEVSDERRFYSMEVDYLDSTYESRSLAELAVGDEVSALDFNYFDYDLNEQNVLDCDNAPIIQGTRLSTAYSKQYCSIEEVDGVKTAVPTGYRVRLSNDRKYLHLKGVATEDSDWGWCFYPLIEDGDTFFPILDKEIDTSPLTFNVNGTQYETHPIKIPIMDVPMNDLSALESGSNYLIEEDFEEIVILYFPGVSDPAVDYYGTGYCYNATIVQ